jgi:hypothetical protein
MKRQVIALLPLLLIFSGAPPRLNTGRKYVPMTKIGLALEKFNAKSKWGCAAPRRLRH